VDLLEGQSQLVTLRAMNNGISEASAGQLCATVSASGAALRTFHFFNNMSGPGGARAIAGLLSEPRLAGLQDLRFSGTRAQAEGTLAVADAIGASLRCLVRLDLNDNTFLAAGAARLSATLKGRGLVSLQVLLLRDGSLGGDGVVDVCKALAAAPPPALRELDLSGNEAGEDGGKAKRAVAAAVGLACFALRPTLASLSLDDNELGSAAAAALGPALAHCGALAKLSLSSNEVRGGKGALPLVKALVAARPGGGALPLLGTEGGLNLDGNCLSESEVGALRAALGDAEGCLGSLDDNDDEADDEDDDDDDDKDDEDEGGGSDDEKADGEVNFAAALEKLRVSAPLPAPLPTPPAAAATELSPARPAAEAAVSAQDAAKKAVRFLCGPLAVLPHCLAPLGTCRSLLTARKHFYRGRWGSRRWMTSFSREWWWGSERGRPPRTPWRGSGTCWRRGP